MLKNSRLSSQPARSYAVPEMTELHRFLSQSLENRGKKFQTSWRSPDKTIQFVLNVICDIKGGEPIWRLQSEQSGNRQENFEYPTCDVLLIHNLISSAVTQTQQTGVKAKIGATPPRLIRGSSAAPAATQFDEQCDDIPEIPADASHPVLDVPFTGDLSKVSPPDLLQKITAAKMTGRLEMRDDDREGLIYVQDGSLVHGTATNLEGNDAIIELLTWTRGHYAFEARVLRNAQTVNETIESLVAQSEQFSNRVNYLRDTNVKAESTLIQKTPKLSDLDFVQRVARGAPANIDQIRAFYAGLDGDKTLDEMAGSISRVKLTNIIYHLLVNDLIKVSGSRVPKKKLSAEPRTIDPSTIEKVMMSLRQAETGMFVFPAFLYFLEQEYFRSYRGKTSFAVIVFEMRVSSDEAVRQTLPKLAVQDAVLRISRLKRHADLLSHYDAFDYALLLPNTNVSGAIMFANRIVKCLGERSLSGLNGESLSMAFGCASIPEDGTDLGSLLGAAEFAMAHSRDNGISAVSYRDIRH